MEYTSGPWRKGKRGFCVVADHPAPGVGGSDATEYYGGHLICESINEPNGDLAIAAPDMLAACEGILGECDAEFLGSIDSMDDGQRVNLSLPAMDIKRIKRAIAKAKGQAD